MGGMFFILMIVAMLAVLASLAIGMFYMSKDGEENRKKSNRWMQYRVMLQGLAILLFALAAMSSGRH